MMREHGGKTYRPWKPERYQQSAYSPAAKLPEGDLVFFLLETVPRLDLSRFYAPYEKETRGAPPYDPAMTNHKGWDYCSNAQASVDDAYQIILAGEVTDAPNDKQQAAPMARATLANLAQAGIDRPTGEGGKSQAIPATLDHGYYSEAAAQALEDLGFDPYMAAGRQKHHEPESETSAAPATAKEHMAAKVRTPEGKALYARRKVIVEPVLGQIKEGRGFRRFLLPGLKKIRGEWLLMCLTHNLLKIWRYGWAQKAA
jgi:hypothetical protein